jgi:hypothetical protein
MGHDTLSSLALLGKEADLAELHETHKIVDEFTCAETHKKNILAHLCYSIAFCCSWQWLTWPMGFYSNNEEKRSLE